MYRLTVLADDFTGALDTGVQFAKLGIETLITTKYRLSKNFEVQPQVLVVNLESRHLEPDLAREAVRTVVLKNDSEYYYKKTDSGMRGNIGAELSGLILKKESLVFVPAFPEAGRVTINGIHYSDGIPISRTVFGQDPFEPVTCDYIPDIIAKQTDICIYTITCDSLQKAKDAFGKGGILVFDAANALQMNHVAEAVAELGPPRLMAGCAGFARYLPEMLSLQMKADPPKNIPPKFIVLSGSINEITMAQIAVASKSGFEVIELSPEEKLCENLTDSQYGKNLLERIDNIHGCGGKVIIQAACSSESIEKTGKLVKKMRLTKDLTRQRISNNIGALAKIIMQKLGSMTLVIFGGDTLEAVLRHIEAESIKPATEIVSGVVLSEVMAKGEKIHIITKSGGFGSRDIIVEVADYIGDHAIDTDN